MKDKLKSTIDEIVEDSITDEVKKAALNQFINLEFGEIRVVLCADMGTKDEKITYTTISNLENVVGGRLNSLIFPGITSEVEEKALLRWR